MYDCIHAECAAVLNEWKSEKPIYTQYYYLCDMRAPSTVYNNNIHFIYVYYCAYGRGKFVKTNTVHLFIEIRPAAESPAARGEQPLKENVCTRLHIYIFVIYKTRTRNKIII